MIEMSFYTSNAVDVELPDGYTADDVAEIYNKWGGIGIKFKDGKYFDQACYANQDSVDGELIQSERWDIMDSHDFKRADTLRAYTLDENDDYEYGEEFYSDN